jgi:hypothetical protein
VTGPAIYPVDEWRRGQALHDAVSFLTFQKMRDVRLPEVADVSYRMEHFIRCGEFPLDPEWKPDPKRDVCDDDVFPERTS